MRPAFRLLRAVAALGGAAALVVPAFTAPAAAEDETVTVGPDSENRFAPSRVVIRPGDTVTWQWAGGSDHTVTSTTANWDKDTAVGPPAVLTLSTSYLFDAPGTYRYVCKTHQGAGMKGVVVVEGSRPSRSPSPTRSPGPTRTSAPPPTSAPPSASESASPSPSTGSATPGLPTASGAPPTEPPVPQPTVAPSPLYLGEGGITAQPASGRDKGLPVMMALLLILGIGSAELRALLANAPH